MSGLVMEADFWKTATPEEVAKALDDGADVEVCSGGRKTPLHYATLNNEAPKVIPLLLKYRAKIDARDEFGFTPMQWAVCNNVKPKVILFLLEKGADIKTHDFSRRTLLHSAVSSPELVALLLKKGVDIEARDYLGETPLLWAAHNGEPEVVDLLLDKGAKIEALANGDERPLHLAQYNKTPEVVRVLLNRGASVNARDKKGNTPLHWAVRYNSVHPEVISLLLDGGADINARNKNGKSPFDYEEDDENLKGNDMAEEVTHLVYQNWTVQRSRVHVVGCGHYKKRGGGSGRNSKWYSCSSYQEARRIMNSFGYEDTGDCSCVYESDPVAEDVVLNEGTKQNEEFEDFIDELIKRSRKGGHIPMVFINMRRRYGTVEAIKRLVDSKDIHKGLRRLQKLGLLHLSLEAAVWKFSDKFTIEIKELARRKLEQVGYDFGLEETSTRTPSTGVERTLTKEDEEKRNRALEQEREREEQERRESEHREQKEAEEKQESLDSSLHQEVVTGQSLAEINSLLDKGANIESREGKYNWTPLHAAICFAKPENESRCLGVIDLLLKRGANIEALDALGRTPLYSAVGYKVLPHQHRLVAIVRLLLNSRANTEARGEHGYTPLHYVISEKEHISNAPEIIAILLEHKANFDSRDDDNNTPLYSVLRSLGKFNADKVEEIVALLLKHDAHINARNKHGYTALHLVAGESHKGETSLKMMKLLLDNGADTKIQDEYGNTPLHLIADSDNETAIKMMKLLLDQNAHINASNKSGDTPLHLAVRRLAHIIHNIEMVKLLLDRGADVAICNHAGKIPFDYIKEERHLKKSDVYHRLRPAFTQDGISAKGRASLIAFVLVFGVGLVTLGEDISFVNLILLAFIAGFFAWLWKILT